MLYSWEGMHEISKAEAIEAYKNDKDVYLLYDDDTEALIENSSEFEMPEVEFGIEIKN